MKKKVLSFVLASALGVTLLAGCGSTSTTSAETSEEKTEEKAEKEEEKTEEKAEEKEEKEEEKEEKEEEKAEEKEEKEEEKAEEDEAEGKEKAAEKEEEKEEKTEEKAEKEEEKAEEKVEKEEEKAEEKEEKEEEKAEEKEEKEEEKAEEKEEKIEEKEEKEEEKTEEKEEKEEEKAEEKEEKEEEKAEEKEEKEEEKAEKDEAEGKEKAAEKEEEKEEKTEEKAEKEEEKTEEKEEKEEEKAEEKEEKEEEKAEEKEEKEEEKAGGGTTIDEDTETTVTLYAAASLQTVMTELIDLYNETYPNIEIAGSYDSSGTLLTQIEEADGVGIDIFFSAAQKQMNTLQDDDDLVVDGTRHDVVNNQVCVITYTDSGTEVTGLDNLELASSMALADGSVPAGKYTREALMNIGILPECDDASVYTTEEVSEALGGLEINECSNVSKVLQAVAEQSNEVGTAYYSDTYGYEDQVEILEVIPYDLTGDVIYPVAQVKNSAADEAESAAALDFINFLTSDDAKAVFEAYYFDTNVGDEEEGDEEVAGLDTDTETTITLYAAASLQTVMTELIDLYNETYPNIEIAGSYDSSGTLLTQIEEADGVGIDIFFSAAQKQMNTLQDDDDLVVDGTRHNVVNNQVCVITYTGSGTEVTGLDNLELASSMALADGSVPAGKYTREALMNIGILPECDDASVYTTEEVSEALGGLEINECSNVSKVLQAVAEQSNEVGTAYYSDTYGYEDQVEILQVIGYDLTGDVIYPVAQVKNSAADEVESAAALDFINFLISDDAKAVFEEFYFDTDVTD